MKNVLPQIVNSVEPNSLPIIVDSPINASLTRCNYLCIECDTPCDGWTISLGGMSAPFFMVGLVGIIRQPFDGQQFTSPLQIEELYRRVEDENGLLISVDDIWLPNWRFRRPPKNGDVFRIAHGLFSAALLWREGRIGKDHFIRAAESYPPCHFSEEEAGAFRGWFEKQVYLARGQYPKNRELALRRIREDAE